jgi:Na+/phosphate symporter
MINGSRLGASFIVLFVGVLYYWGRRRTADGIYIGVVALLTTFTIYAPVVPLGSLVLERGWFDGVQASMPAFMVDFKGFVFQPAVNWGAQHLPRLLLFASGVGLLLSSFAVFDRALPNLEQSGLRGERISRLLHQPLVIFALGLLVTAMTLSVSISLTLLIPLSLKGYLRREGIIPYVMGANISTWVDTMAVALLLDVPRAFTIVFTQMVVGAAISLAILVLAYKPYSRAILALARRVTRRRQVFVLFLGAILVLPLALFLT